jgi:hypothetical protein
MKVRDPSVGKKAQTRSNSVKRDWKTFFRYSLRALKGSLVGLLLVPFFYIVMNPHFHEEFFLQGLLASLRIGAEVVVVNILVTTFIYAVVYWRSISGMLRLKSSVQFRFAIGFVGMTLGLLVASGVEARFGGQDLNVQGITTGLLIGGITYLAFILRAAYRETQSHNLQLRAESAEMNLHVLKNQMQPHFLFNSLNSLAELIDSNREHASQMTQNLSDLYREILESSKTQSSSLGSEISIVKKYLDLESLRFGSRLRYEIQVSEEIYGLQIPSLILQTLVENAIKHGISQSLHGGSVLLRVSPRQEGYFVQIQNTSSPKKANVGIAGTGIANTVSRLDLVCGSKHGFKMNTIDDVTSVEFYLTGVLGA